MSTNSSQGGQGIVTAADHCEPLLTTLLHDQIPVRFQFWDGSTLGDGSRGTVLVRSSDALRRVVWAPGELGLSRAFVVGDIDVEGDILDILHALMSAADGRSQSAGREGGAGRWRVARTALHTARRVGAFGKPLPPPPEEARARGRRHSLRRDAAAISHHYDVGNDFYQLVLGQSMTYSCARYVEPTATLEEAQTSKYELICRKLGLPERPGARLLDVGCGWGGMAMYAARVYGAKAVGITISRSQADLARQRVAEAGLDGQVEIRLQDYRELAGEKFEAISSIGMFEHVGGERLATYLRVLRDLLSPLGRLLNHGISSVNSHGPVSPHSFIGRYIFPDGELIDVGRVILAMERAGFEVRDVESLREHYAKTLRTWVANLERNWDRAVALVGERRARIWRLYMAACAVNFEAGGISVHQVLGVVPNTARQSGMPLTRQAWG